MGGGVFVGVGLKDLLPGGKRVGHFKWRIGAAVASGVVDFAGEEVEHAAGDRP